MNTNLSIAIKEAYASAPTNTILYHTLHLYHPSFGSLYVVRDFKDLLANLETGEQVTFVGYAFNVVPPDITTEGLPRCTIEIDNVSSQIVDKIELAMQTPRTPITVTYRVFLSDRLLLGPENNPPLVLNVFSIEANSKKITAVCGYYDLLNKKFPRLYYTVDKFPGLER